jgi:beta-1,4-mannosyltransferase
MMKHAVVIVLGDTGRSPRMQFHASSLSELDEVERVTLIGYSGENCNDAITQNHSIRDMRINSNVFKSIEFLRKYSSILHAIVKGIVLVLSIISLLFQSSKSFIDENGKELKSIPISFVIIQNPPATPVILATVLYRVLLFIYSIVTFSDPTSKTFTICIDWHNLGFTLYYDRYKPTHILVRISYHLEHVMAQLSDMNLCVSAAMQKWLLTNYGIDSTVFYDRPPKSVFQKFDTNNDSQRDSVGSSGDVDDSDWNRESIGKDSDESSCCCVPLSVRHELLRKLKLTDTALFPSLLHPLYTGQDTPCTDADSDIDHYPDTVMTEVTIQTYRHRRTGELHMRQDRAVVLLSSTSWTADEDFTLLTKALSNLDKSIAKRRGSESPRKKLNHAKRFSDQQVSDVCTRVVVVITGKGPMKEQFMSDWNESQREGSPTKLNLITLVTVWLEIGDYPLMVGCADMGICLHTSSSGVDLPMKV